MTTRHKASGSRKINKTGGAPSNRVSVPSSFGCIAWSDSRDAFFGDGNAAYILSLPVEALQKGIARERFRDLFEIGDDVVSPSQLVDTPRHLHISASNGARYRLLLSPQKDGWFSFISPFGAISEAEGARDALLVNLMRDARDGFYLLDNAGCIVFASGVSLFGAAQGLGASAFGADWASSWMGRGKIIAERVVSAAFRGQAGQFEEYAFAPDGTLHRWHVRVTPIPSLDNLLGEAKRKPAYILCVCRDITASSQDHERLELALYAGAISGGWIWDAKARLLRGDQRMAATLAVTVAQMASGLTFRHALRRVATDDRSVLKSALRDSVAARGRLQCELRVKAPDGRGWLWVEADGLWETSSDGEVVGLPGILLDIDEKKRQALKREALLALIDGLRHLRQERAILDLSSRVMGETIEADRAAFADVDAGRDLVLVSALWSREPAFAQLSTMASFRPLRALYRKLEKGEVVSVPDVVTHPLTQHHSAALLREKIRALFYVPLFEDGTFRALAMVHYAEPHRWDRINMSFILTVADRGWAALRQNRAQEDLRRINGNLEEQVGRRTRERDSIWAITDDLLASMDLEGRLRHVNPSWSRCVDLDLSRYKGRMLSDLIHMQDRQKFAQMLEGLRANQVEPSSDLRLRFEDQSWHTFNWTGFRESDEIFLIGRDMTDRIVLEDQLRQSQKMEAVGQLTGGLAHDFNNILGGISGALGLMRRRIERGDHDGLERYVSAAQEATNRAAALTHRLLAFSRQQTLDPTLTDVNELVSGMAEFLNRILGPTIRLDLALQTDVGTILIDRNQLENALLNLCINARDAMPEGGVVTISTALPPEEIPLAEDAGRYVSLCVTDTGSGMSPEVMARAFDPFFTTKPIGKGTGLGLSMIYGFASQSGGRVDIESKMLEGSTIRITLPLYRGPIDAASMASSRTSPSEQADLSRLKLLLVEDDATMRFTLHELLLERGISVDVAETGAMALTMLGDADQHYDVLMTDVGLPGGVNGRQLADKARATHPGLAVLFMTGYAEQTVFTDQRFDESMQILFKPFSTDTLDEKLSHVVENLAIAKTRSKP